jgi:hypothetical protein
MLIRTIIGVLSGAALAVSAQAQSFDGTYKGSVTITKRVGQLGLECPPVGQSIPITVRMSGGSVSLTHAFATYPGTVDGKGNVRIHGTRPGPGGSDRISAIYSGRLRGRTVSGSAVATTTSTECHGRFSARR